MSRGRRAIARRAAFALVAFLGLGFGAAPVWADPDDTADVSATDADYAAGRKAIDARSWSVAVQRFELAERRHPDNADLQNYLGYAYRNLGKYDAALAHYKRALALDPRHRGAHEYIGETYLIMGDLPAAERHLAALREICLLPCEEQDDLQKAIAVWRAKQGPR
jgi:tetratricopeptide (TPR) repeat protein